MDIAKLSMNIAQTNILNSVGTAMLAKSIDMAETFGNSVNGMLDSAALERSVNPDIGGNIDIRL